MRLDCWLPTFKVSGCRLARHIILHSSSSQLVFYGRAELLTEPLTRLVASSEASVVRAAGQSLLSLTTIRHQTSHPATPGQADIMMAAVISSLELCSEQERREIYCDLARDLIPVLGPGAARWVSTLTNMMISLLDNITPPASVFSILRLLSSQCGECVAREISPLLAALFQSLYTLSLASQIDSQTDSRALSDVRECIEHVALCDIDSARRLCHGLQHISVNKTFDSLTRDIMNNLDT